PRTVPLALAAAREAFKDAGIATENLSLEERQQIGVEIGTGGGGLPFVEDHYAIWYNGRSHSKASVYIIPAATHGTLSSELSMVFGLRGFTRRVDGLHQFHRCDRLCRATYRAGAAGVDDN